MRRLSFSMAVSCCLIILSPLIMQAQELTAEENKLYDLLMQYRREHGLKDIPISKSLTLVAQTHVKDLQENYVWSERCNLHSWSDKGPWKPVCYTDDHAQAELMWNKPKELTSYQGNGFEIAFTGYVDSTAMAEKALATWKSSNGHNAVVLNEGIWKTEWKAIGIGIFGSYAVVWFGNEAENKNCP